MKPAITKIFDSLGLASSPPLRRARAPDPQLDFDPVLSVAYPLLADGTGVSAAGKRGDASVRLPIARTAYIEHEALPFRFHDDDECSTPGQRLVQPLRIDVRLNGQRVVAILGPGVTRVIGFSTPDPSFDLMLKPTGIAGGESRVEDALIPELGAGYDIETNDVDLSRAILDARTCAGLQETAGYGFRVVHSGVNGTRTGVNTSPRMLEQAIRTCSRLAGGARRSSARA